MISSKPSQYIKGWVEFYKLKFKVGPDVLIPRPETELLVDEVLKSIKYYVSGIQKEEILILDVGTGAGNIAISIAKNAPNVKIIATDISEKALQVARQNAKLHGVKNKIRFIQSDLLQNIRRPYGILSTPTIIVTNLPYIPSTRIPYLDSSVKDFEPHVALDGGEDGFDLYRKLFKQLKEKNWLARRSLGEGRKLKIFVGEIDYTHGELAINEAQIFFPKAQVEIKTDLTQRQRILIIYQIS